MEKSAVFRAAALATAVAAIALPSQASAAPETAPPASAYVSAKSEAILGGSSQLAAILARQGAPVRRVATPLAPASFTTSYVRRPTHAVLEAPGPAVSPGALSGRPDVFGSLALAVGHTPLDARWRKVRNARLSRGQAAYAHALRGRSEMARLEAVNGYVNGRVRFADDSRRYGRADVWGAASETLSRGLGDCEDYAIAKLQLLRAAGFSDRDLYLVIVKDLVRRADHAVLVVRAGKRMLVLDNGTDRVLESESIHDYRPVLTFAENGAWTHGYRRAAPALQIAALSPTPLVPAAR